MSTKAEKVFDKLANVLGMVENNELAYNDPAKRKHMMNESGKMVENNQMAMATETKDKHEPPLSGGEGDGNSKYPEKHAPRLEADKVKKQAAVEKLAQKWING